MEQEQTNQNTKPSQLKQLIWIGVGLIGLIGLGLAVKIYFDYRATKNQIPIGYEQRADGARRVTHAEGLDSNQNPCFSPDGKKLVYTHFLNGYNRGPSELMILDLESLEKRVLIGDGEHDYVNSPSGCWDKESDQIVFSADWEGHFEEIWTIKSDGSDLKQITFHNDARRFTEPVFAPNGSQIAFQSSEVSEDEDKQNGKIMLVATSGSEINEVVSNSKDGMQSDNRQPSWSQDHQLLFQRRFNLEGDWTPWDIFTTQLTMLGEWQAPENQTGGEADSRFDETDSIWSLDGKWIFASSDYGSLVHPSIWIFPINGNNPVRITNDPDHEDGAPSLSPDGQWLAFESHRSGDETSQSDIWITKSSLTN